MSAPVKDRVEGSVTVAAAAADLNTTTKFIRSRIDDGTNKAFRIKGSRLIRIPIAELEALKQPVGDNADDNPDDIDAEIKRLVDLAPKLTPAQRDTIAALFATVHDGGGVNGAA